MADLSVPPSSKSSRPLWKRIFISPSEPRLRAGWRLSGQFFILTNLLLFLGLILGFFGLILNGVRFLNSLFVQSLVSVVAITLSVYLARRFLDRRSFKSLGLRLNVYAIWDVLVGICITALMMGLIFGIELTFGWLTFQGFSWSQSPATHVAQEILAAFIIFIFVGWQEELFVRGYQMQNYADGLNMAWGVFISSVLFGLMHLGNPNASMMSTLGILLAGLFLAYAYLVTHQLWLPIGLHIGWNFFEGTIFGFPVSGLNGFHLIRHTVVGPKLVTGGAFGPEAGVILIPAIILGTVLITLYGRIGNREKFDLAPANNTTLTKSTTPFERSSQDNSTIVT